MHPWKSQLHFRLYLMGHNGRTRQRIIDYAATALLDPIQLGVAIATQNALKRDTLEIKIPRYSWIKELWLTICYWFDVLVDWIGVRC